MPITDQEIPLIIAVLAFVVISFLSLGIMMYFSGLRARRRMLDKIQAANDPWKTSEPEHSGLELSSRPSSGFVRFLYKIGLKNDPGKDQQDQQDIKIRFIRAGIRTKDAVTVFRGVKFLLTIALPLGFVIPCIIFKADIQPNNLLLGAAFLACFGMFLPNWWLRSKTSNRKDKLLKAFPDALDLLVVCVEAGMGLDSAIKRVGDELGLSHPELSEELKQMNLELRAGKPRQTAMRNLANRTDIDDVNSLVTLLIQTDRFGTSVTQALRVFADSFRSARFQRAEELAAKLATKLIFPLAIFIFPTFLIVAIGPAAIQIFRTLIQK